MKKIRGLIEEEDLYLKVTLGRQRRKRFFSPIKAANIIKKALNAGERKKDLKEKVGVSVDMINKVLRLSSITNPKITSSIVWQSQGPGQISMSVASELARLNNSQEQIKLFEGILKHNFNKAEVKELVTLYSRSKKSIDECIVQIRDARPKTIHTYVIIGKITSEILSKKLATIPNLERNRILRDVINENLPSINYRGLKLKKTKFIIIGDEETGDQLSSLEGGFEDVITDFLDKKLCQQNES